MQIDLPEPRLPVRVGPPAPPDPTYATFSRDVGSCAATSASPPDQLDCDHLQPDPLARPRSPPPPRPRPEPRPKPGPTAPRPSAKSGRRRPASGGPMTELALREAEATGHAVWLQSEGQGIKAGATS